MNAHMTTTMTATIEALAVAKAVYHLDGCDRMTIRALHAEEEWIGQAVSGAMGRIESDGRIMTNDEKKRFASLMQTKLRKMI